MSDVFCRANIEAPACAPTTQDREGVRAKAEEGKEACEEGNFAAHMTQYGANMISEPRVALESKEGSWNPEPVPVQRQDPRRG
jgi:hypothetical protein